jgi:hypothetical protein
MKRGNQALDIGKDHFQTLPLEVHLSILTRLTNNEHLFVVLQYRLVASTWAALMRQVTQLTLPLCWPQPKDYSGLTALFTGLTSLVMPMPLLLKPPLKGLTQITSLVVQEFWDDTDSFCDDEDTREVIDLSLCCPNLTALDCSQTRDHYVNVGQLTSLTSLCTAGNSINPDDIYALNRLQSLDCSDALLSLDVGRLTSLTSLSSNLPAHFTSYTGKGSLTGFKEQHLEQGWGTDQEINALFDAIHEGCTECALRGRWSGGLFDGFGYVKYEVAGKGGGGGDENTDKARECREYAGDFRKNQKHGFGRDKGDRMRYYGGWEQGREHGNGVVEFFSGALDDEDSQTALVSLLCQWEHGTLIAIEKVGGSAASQLCVDPQKLININGHRWLL